MLSWMQNSHEQMWPLLVDRYVPGLECEIDVISDGEDIVVPGIFEHIEKAGVHSGDSISVFPPVSLSREIKETLIDYEPQNCQSITDHRHDEYSICHLRKQGLCPRGQSALIKNSANY